MKFVVNTSYGIGGQQGGTRVLDGILKRLIAEGHTVTRNDWENYQNYDVAIFTAPDSKVRETKSKYPKLLCGIFDPKVTLERQRQESGASDFLIVSSIEQRDMFIKYSKNVFIYYMFIDIPTFNKEHVKKDKIIVGYNGNNQHLASMRDVVWALDEIAKVRDIELWAVYNFGKLGKWKVNFPKVCPVKHIQWDEKTWVSNLNQCDIGIVPSATPAPALFARPFWSFFYNPVGYSPNDYVLRFKMSTNPGRIHVCAETGIPVIADFTPSSCQLIKDMHSGILTGSKEGWKNAIEMLADSPELRNKMSKNLKHTIDTEYSVEASFKRLVEFLDGLYTKKQRGEL